MPKTNKLDPVTLDFFDTAPLRVQCTIVAKCSPEVLFETLRGDAVWTEWAGVIAAAARSQQPAQELAQIT